MTKTLYCIRHGLAQHNLNYTKYGVKTFYDKNYKDTRLVSQGIQQAKTLRNNWSNINDIELVLVSPLMRTLQTANILFKDKDIPIIALECVREFPMGLQTCNYRSSRREYETKFPHIDFSDLKTNYDELWFPEREETIEELTIRIEKMVKWILLRKETNIALVNHSSFIGQLKDKEIKLLENNEKELLHCFPYKLKL